MDTLPSDTGNIQMPTSGQQSFGAFISIVIIILMILVGAFYSWSKRYAQQNPFPAATTTDQAAL